MIKLKVQRRNTRHTHVNAYARSGALLGKLCFRNEEWKQLKRDGALWVIDGDKRDTLTVEESNVSDK